MKKTCVLALFLLLITCLTACTAQSEEPEPTIVITPAPIAEVKISTTLSQPIEVMVYVKGGLKDSCTTFYSLDSERTGNTVNITAEIQTVEGQICAQIYTFFERCVDLGSDFTTGQSYTILVNGNKNTFVMP